MKRTTLPLILSALLATGAVAAPADDTAEMPPPQQRQQGPDIAGLTQQLGLSSEQADALKTIMEKQRQEMEAMRQGDQQQNEAAMQQRHSQREKHREELLTVLSYEQLYKFEKYMEQHRPRPGSPKPGMQRSMPR